jgi:hypothetical protein
MLHGGNHLDFSKRALSNEAFEKFLLDKWYHAKGKDEARTKGLFSGGKSILQVHGCIQQEKVIVSINPSCQQNFINVQLVNRLQVPSQRIFKAHRLRVKMFNFLNI